MTAEPKEELSPGLRFHPTDEELITFYLMNKINDATFTARAIADVDLNKCEPWELPARAKMGENEWYFFSLGDRKYRATNTGYWKATGKNREIINSVTSKLAGMKKTLIFYRGRAPRGKKSNWVMHEYSIHSKSDFRTSKNEWVICRVFQKRKDINEYPTNQSGAANPNNVEIGPSKVLSPLMQLGDPNHHQFPYGRNYATSTALETSSPSSPCSSSSSSSPYDVFLSFNGEDTRKTFTDHLYWTMKDAGIDFFMEENESIRRGENISDKVKQIIEGSRVSVIVFSSRYADSIWCLEELVHIMECRKTLKQRVLPIFYDLSPSDAMGTFALAFQKHRERFNKDTDKEEKIQRWTDALTEGADLTTWVFRTTNGYEGMFIREIIEEITRQLKSSIPIGTAFSELQGIDSPLQSGIDFLETENLFQIAEMSQVSPKRKKMPLYSPDDPSWATCDSGLVPDSGKYHGSKISQQDHLPPPQPSSMHNNAEILPVSSIQGQWKKGKFIRFCALGNVYLATNRETGALCEMKEVVLNYVLDADRIKYLEQEIKILCTLTHANIVEYYGSEVIDNHLCSYMEYVPVSIDEYVQDLVGAMTESVVRNFTHHILSGLAFLHGRKMIHRDIRGANLRVDASGVVKLANFGLAKHLNGQSNILSFKHSPNWMAPELIWMSRQNKADPDFDLAIDIWSLGCTIIEMFTGKPPWSELTLLEVMQKLVNSIPDIPETLSAEGKDFLELCFRRNPAERPLAVQLLDHSFVQDNGHIQRMAPLQSPSMGWPGKQGIPAIPIVKRVIRLDVPVDKYPHFNFVGRILGPRGNSLKRVEAMTECRVYIRGRGSVKDPVKEEKLKDKPGHEHLNEPLHVLVEAEFPEDVINTRLDHAVAILEDLLKPVDESVKKQQLRELAMLNCTLREESPSMSPSLKPEHVSLQQYRYETSHDRKIIKSSKYADCE